MRRERCNVALFRPTFSAFAFPYVRLTTGSLALSYVAFTGCLTLFLFWRNMQLICISLQISSFLDTPQTWHFPAFIINYLWGILVWNFTGTFWGHPRLSYVLAKMLKGHLLCPLSIFARTEACHIISSLSECIRAGVCFHTRWNLFTLLCQVHLASDIQGNKACGLYFVPQQSDPYVCVLGSPHIFSVYSDIWLPVVFFWPWAALASNQVSKALICT